MAREPDGPVVARMQRELDAVADRLGALYQSVGDGRPATEWALDEIVALTAEVERISIRNLRSK
jgi:hypothetical protein